MGKYAQFYWFVIMVLSMPMLLVINILYWSFPVAMHIVVRHLLNLNFWVTSLKEHNTTLLFGNLTANNPSSLTLGNFGEMIDIGAPSPAESGPLSNRKLIVLFPS